MLRKLIDRPVSVTMVLLVLIVLGIVGICRLPVSLAPDVDIPFATIQVTSPEMSAHELDESVVKPLIQSLVQVDHLKDIRCESSDGSATLTLSFDEGQDIDLCYIEVNERIDRAMSSLPRIERPKVFKASATDIPSFYLNLTLRDGSDFLRMSEFAQDVIAKRFEQLPEVAMVDISGTAKREVLIVPDQDALAHLGITIDDFEKYASAANVSLSNVNVRDGDYHYNVKFRSFANSADDIANVYFQAGNRLLQIKDVASVTERDAPRTGLVLSDGQEAVVLAIIKQGDARMADLRRSIADQISLLSQDYPQIEITTTRDQTELLDYSIRNLLLNIVFAIILVCIIIFLFMKDLRTPLLVSLTIPVSLVISFFIFYLIGLSINIISLSGLLLGLGMMVDNSIVLTDNISARWQRGEALRDSIVEGTREVAGAMLSSVLTTCAVFIPLVFLNGLAGDLFFDQAVSITVVLLVSYLVTVLLIPVYYWGLYRKMPAFKPNRVLSRLSLPGGMRLYDRITSWCLSHRWFVWVTPVICSVIAVLCIVYMPREKLPPVTYTDTILNVDWNEHITIEQNRLRVGQLLDGLGPEVQQSTAMIGVQQFVLRHSGDQTIGEVALYIKCEDASTLEAVKKTLVEQIGVRYPEAIVGFSNSGNIFDSIFGEEEPQLLARLRPLDSNATLSVDATEAELSRLREVVPNVEIDPIPTKQDVVYVSEPELMAVYGVSFSDLVQVLRNSLNGNTLFELVQGTRSIPVVMGTDVKELEEILESETITVRKGDDRVDIPVSALMKQTYESDFKSIVSGSDGNYYPVEMEMPSRDVPAAISAIRSTVLEGKNFDVSFSGAWFSNRELLRQIGLILLIAITLLFLILASQFESLIQPLIILSEIVIDIAFSMLCLCACGVSINIMSLIGLIVITGIVINDSILKIDTINRLIEDGMELVDAVHEAGHRRLKAIIMTSLTTILAVVPFLSRGNIGADLQYPMAIVIIFGMTIGTLVSLFYVPALYAFIYKKRR